MVAAGEIISTQWGVVLLIVGGLVGSGGLGAYFRLRAQNRLNDAEAGEHRQSSAKLLAEAYGVLVDDLREDLRDARTHISRQDEELRSLRAEVHAIVTTKDAELAAVRLELSNERSVNARLRERVTILEATISPGPAAPPAAA